jgi:NAD(P)-dependent dehydrogenase (short-subunit alcohol dehydrogenase family)
VAGGEVSVALVTGAARRLGRAMALALADDGWDVAVHYAGSEAEAERTASEIRANGRRAATFRADLLDEAQIGDLVPRVEDVLGQPTLLVNNASIFEHDTVGTATRESWDRHLMSNLRAPFVLTQAVAARAPDPRVDEAGEPVAQAQVVNMIDQRVLKPTPAFMTYSLAKAGLWWLTRTTAQGLAPRLRVNAIGPGPTLRGARQSESHFRGQRQATILERGADPSGIVHALRYLVTSPSVTGQLLCVDGGQHLCWQTPDVQGVE